jgi:RNA polymerase sigma-70 factor (ECF subfamily)
MDEAFDTATAAALRARRGDRDAAATFVRATQADVWRCCAGLSRADRADDLTQETYARAFASLHRFEGRSTARTWLLSIARRVCADHVRAELRLRAVDGAVRAEVSTTPGHRSDVSDGVVLRALLASLDAERREAFVLTQLVGLSYAEAADVCNCPIGTIRSRVARARGDLIDGYQAGRGAAASG